MKIAFSNPAEVNTGVVVAGVLEGRKLLPSAAALDKKCDGALSRAMKASRFEGKKNQSLTVMAPSGTKLDRILLIGFGKAKNVTALDAEKAGGGIYATLSSVGARTWRHRSIA